jgi:hypothetical protein
MNNFPRIDEDLVLALEKMYKPYPYDPKLNSEDFTREAAFAAGQVDVVTKLKIIFEKQRKERINV